MIERSKKFFKRYERWVSPVTLIIGFTFDNLTLRHIEAFYSNALLISYLLISAFSIMLLNIKEAKNDSSQEKDRPMMLRIILIFMMQFCLGGLFSASFIFYSRSGSLISSWPFLFLLFTYVIGNEILREKYIRLSFQIGVFFTAIFSYLIFFLPVIFGKMGDAIFVISGISSLILIALFIYVLSWFAPSRVKASASYATAVIIGLFVIINGLYFTNLIPPIPLTLKHAGIYRTLDKLPDGTYRTVGDPQTWFNFFEQDPVIHNDPGGSLFALSSISAPASFETDIVHVWRRYDTDKALWTTAATIDLNIAGGRENGFRTYSIKDNITFGRWRVEVRTPRGQLIGRLEFTVVPFLGNEETVEEIK